MKRLFTLSLAVGAALAAPRARATNYYVSAQGQDANAGTSPGAAWQTLAKVNASMARLQPGDSVLFRRGDTFRGGLVITRSGAAGAPLVFAAYGAGTGPVLSGAEPLAGWQLWRNGIWRAPVPATGELTQLFSAGQSRANQPRPARHPNADYFALDDTVQVRNAAGVKLSYPRSNALTEPNGAWTGARFHARFENWEWFVGDVTNFSGATHQLDLNKNPYNNRQGFRLGWGFYLTNKLRALDAPQEWYYSAAGDSVYYQPPAGLDPNNLGLEGSVTANVVQVNGTCRFVSLRNLAVARAAGNGVNVSGNAQDLELANCEVRQAARTGVALGFQARRCRLLGCRLLDSGYQAITSSRCEYVTLDRCEVRRTALVPGLYENLGPGVALTGGGHHHVVRYCRIDSTGKHGIDLRDSLSVVEKTVITNSSLIASDVGAVYIITTGARRDTVRQCFLSGTRSYAGAKPAAANYPQGVGLYVDDYAETAVLLNNTSYDNDAMGVHLINGRRCQVRGNVTYGNGRYELSFYEANDRTPPLPLGWSTGHVVQLNTFYSLAADASVVRMSTQYNGVNFGTTNDNLYLNPYTERLFTLETRPAPGSAPATQTLSFDGWRQYAPSQDTRSGVSRWQLTGYANVQYGPALFNYDFAAGIQGWGNSNASQFSLAYEPTSALDGGAARAAYTGPRGGTAQTYLSAPARFAVASNQLYQLDFSVLGTKRATDVRAQVLSAANNSLGLDMLFPLALTRRNHVRIFRATGADAQAKFNLVMSASDSVLRFDNVRLRPVTSATADDPRLRSVLLTNPADQPRVVPLSGAYYNPDGTLIPGTSVTVAPWSSRIVIKGDGLPTAQPLAALAARPLALGFYPNPTAGLLALPASLPAGRLQVRDALGRLVRAENLPADARFLDLSALPAGLYLLSLQTADGAVLAGKVQRE